MQTNIATDTTAPAQILARAALAEATMQMKVSLPAPDDPSPAAERQRDDAAIAAISSLAPATAAEVRLAAQYVLADAHALRCLAVAETTADPMMAERWQKRAVSLLRESKSSLRLLLKLQAVRERRDEAAAGRAAWVELGVAGLMSGRDSTPDPEPEPQAQASRDADEIPGRKIPDYGIDRGLVAQFEEEARRLDERLALEARRRLRKMVK